FGHERALVARTCSPAKLPGLVKFGGTPRCNDARRCHPFAWHSQAAPARNGLASNQRTAPPVRYLSAPSGSKESGSSFDDLLGAGEQLPKRTLSEFAVVP